MKVHLLLPDENCWEIYPRDDEAWDRLKFDCRPMAHSWRSPRCYVYNPKARRTDFAMLTSSALVLSEEARERLARETDDIARAGELLPLEVEDEGPWWILNVLNCVNCLDKDRAVFRTLPAGRRGGGIAKYAFHPVLSESSIFKIPETSRSEILAYTGVTAEPSEEFVNLVAELRMSGLRFEELWSGDVG